MDAFAVMLSPFVAGQNGFEVEVSDRQRIEIGAALKRIHTLALPESLRQRIPRESYAPYWRDLVRGFPGARRGYRLCRAGCGPINGAFAGETR